MAAFAPTSSNSVTLTFAGGGTTSAPRGDFIPALWSDEIVAAFKQNLIIAPNCSNLSHVGKKGDAIYIPAPNRGTASAKAAGTSVTLQAANENSVRVVIDKHFEYSRLIEDIVSVQALPTLRKFYVDDAGYALAQRVDRDLSLKFHYLNNGNTSPAANNIFRAAVKGDDGSTAFTSASGGNGTSLTDAGLRRMMQTLDDNDIPLSERVIILPPVEKKNLLGIPRYTEQAFVGNGAPIGTGMVGNVYGMDIFVTTNCPFIHCNSVTNSASVTFSSTAPTGGAFADEYGLTVDWSTSSPTDTKYRAGVMLHKSALVLIEQMNVRTQVQYKQEFLADLITADTIYGVGRLRDGTTESGVTVGLASAGLAFVVPA